MADNFLPNGDISLGGWSRNFSNQINSAPLELGLTPALSAQYAILDADYAAAMAASSDPATRTRSSVSRKNDARSKLRASARRLARIIQAHPGVTNAQRANLQLSLRPGGGGAPPLKGPQERPSLNIPYTSGRRIRLTLRRSGTNARGREPGTDGAIIFRFAGENPPTDPLTWTFDQLTSRTSLNIEIPPSIPAGTKIWLAAFWYATRGKLGPVGMPVSTHVGDGVAKAA